MTDSAKKNNSPPSGQNSTVSLQRSPSPSSDEYEKVEKGTPSPSDSSRKDLWTKVDADGSHSGESQCPRSVTTISRTNSSLEPESEQDYDNAFNESERARPEEPLDISHFNTHLLKIDNVAPKNRQELYSKAFDIFSKVQSLRRKIDSTYISGSNPLMNKLAHYAKEYTSQLLGYYEYITQNKASEQDEKTYIKDVLRFWRLAEILCFSGNSDDVVTLELCAWLNTYWVEDDEDDEEEEEHVIVEKPSSEEGSDSEEKSSDDQKECRLQVEKWKLIQKHLLRGNIREAKGLMHHLSRKASPEIRAHLEQLVQLLSNLPQLPSNKASPGDFAKWNEWSKQRNDARQEYYRLKNNDNDDNSASEYLDDIYSIISGDDEAIARLGTFWERFAAALLYREPFRTRSDIVNTAESIFPESKEKSSSVVYACHSLLMREWDDALGLFDDFWTQVHLGHLLMATNILGDRDLYVVSKDGSGLDSETATEPVYHIMNIYATHIAREYGMWKEAFTYIGACKTNRDYWACKLIDEMPKDDRQTLEKFLECSKDFQLVSAQRSLYKTMAECCEKDNDIATAIKCYSKAHDAASLDRLAHQIMKKFLDDGKLAEMPDEDDIDKEILGKCKHYAFLLKYKALQSCLDQDRSMEAARYIKDLLHSLDAPREFRAVLLMEALPLLVSEEESSSGNLVFNEQETEDLIKHFQDATQRGEIPKDVFVKQHKKFNAASSVQHLLKKVGHNLRYNLAKAIAES